MNVGCRRRLETKVDGIGVVFRTFHAPDTVVSNLASFSTKGGNGDNK